MFLYTVLYIVCFRKKEDSLYSIPPANNGNLVLTLPTITARNCYVSEHNRGSDTSAEKL